VQSGGSQVAEDKLMESTSQIRVRYAETDAMGIVHHDGAPSAIERSEEREHSAVRCAIGG
jgi:hypothetical protein